MSVVGFDDHELADVIGLTTVAQPVAGQGAEAARLLLRQLDEPGAEVPAHVQMPIRLVLRETTAPPRPRTPVTPPWLSGPEAPHPHTGKHQRTSKPSHRTEAQA